MMNKDEKLELYEQALREIATTGTSQPIGANIPEGEWYREIAWAVIGKAARTLQKGQS